MQICTLTLLVLVYGSNGIHATDLHHANPRHDDALHNGPPPLTGQASNFEMDSSSSEHDPSNSSGLHESLPPSPISLNNLHNDSLFPVLYYHPDSLPIQTNLRIRRDATPDKAQDFLNHVSIVAHIVNGIALQTGLMDGKIKMDELVGELLNFGDVPVSAIAKFNPTPITSLTSNLKNIQSSLNSDYKSFEDQTLFWNDLIVKSRTIGDLTKLHGKDIYLAAVGKFKTDTKVDSLTNPAAYLTSAINTLNEIEAFNMATLDLKGKPNELYQKFSSMQEYLGYFVSSIPDFSKNLTSLKETKLNTGPTVYEPFETMIDLSYRRNDYNLPIDQDNQAAIKGNLKVISKLSKDSQAATQDIANIASLVASRSSTHFTKKKFTDGLPNGVADIKKLTTEVRDPWIGKMTGAEGSRLGGLSDGLQPLFSMNGRLIKLDEKLKTISSEKSSKSLSSMKHLQEELTGLAPDAAELSDTVLKGYEDCLTNAGVVLNDKYKDISQVIDKAHTLKKIADFELSGFDSKDFESKNQEFVKNLGFTDINNKAKSLPELKSVMQKIKNADGLKEIKERITEVKNMFAVMDVKDLNTFADFILKNDKKLTAAKFTMEKNFHKCLQAFEGNSAKVALAISATQKLRKLNQEDISEVETSISTITEVSKGLVEIEKTPEAMKKDSKKATSDLNKFSDSMKKSKEIGQSVASLHYAYVLKDLESDIAQLKAVKTKVETEIGQVTNPAERKKLADQWGDHNGEMASLDKTIADAKEFDSKLDVSKAKTMGEYSNPLKELSTISDSKINPLEKSKTLEFLLALPLLDPSSRSDLEQSKKTLDQLAGLDLTFSSYKSQYQSAPGAFKALNDFLTSFLKEDHNVITVVDNGSGGLLMVGGIVGALVVAVLIGLVSWYFIHTSNAKKKGKNGVEYWIRQHEFSGKQDATKLVKETMRCAYTIFNNLTNDNVASSLAYLDEDKHRYPGAVPCNPAFPVAFKVGKEDIRVHANIVPIKKDKWKRLPISKKEQLVRQYIATQGPTENTMRDFWLMVAHYKCEFIVMLCNFVENDNIKCHEYFHPEAGESKTCKSITVTTVSKTELFNGEVIERRLKITGHSKSTQYITHYHFVNWPDKSIPEGHETALQLLNLVKKSKKPITVHCSAGIGRTISFIGLDYVAAEVKNNPELSLIQIMKQLREYRWGGVQTIQQLYWILMGAILNLTREFKLDENRYTRQMEVFRDAKDLVFIAEVEIGTEKYPDPEELRRAREAEAPKNERQAARGDDGSLVESSVRVEVVNEEEEEGEN